MFASYVCAGEKTTENVINMNKEKNERKISIYVYTKKTHHTNALTPTPDIKRIRKKSEKPENVKSKKEEAKRAKKRAKNSQTRLARARMVCKSKGMKIYCGI